MTAVVMSVTLLLLIGGWGVDQGRLSIGQFLAFYAGVAILRTPAQSLGNAAPILDSARDARRLLRRLESDFAPLPQEGTKIVDLDDGIEIRDLHFAYADTPVLSGVDLTLRRGRFTALVGPNGAGKTTLVLQLLGLLEPDSGTRLADGEPYDEVDLSRLRNRIGVSFQQAALAEASIVDNITYGRPFDEAEIEEAIQLSGLDSILATLEEGRHTFVGPGGRRLSKGQEQRIALARAVVGHPEVLVLDEPTNHLDPNAVATFLEKLAAQPQRPAVLVVSHDHRALDMADEIVELRDGRISAAATPRP
jgi:ABC-type bacteriocin/lantibiotic exporter with double-glycine peptidase domain